MRSMTDKNRALLSEAGIEVEALLERSGGNEGLLFRLLGFFLKDDNFEKLEKAMESGDREAALTASHTLKGVAGNLSMEKLYEETSRQVRAMRSGDWESAGERMDEIRSLYEKARMNISTSLEEA